MINSETAIRRIARAALPTGHTTSPETHSSDRGNLQETSHVCDVRLHISN